MTLLEGKLTHSFNCLTPPLAVKLSNVFFFFNLHQQKQFQKAMNLVGEEFLDRVCFYRDSWLPARGLVKEALCKRQEVHLAVLIHSGEKVMLLQNSRNYCLTFFFLSTRPTTLILGGNAQSPFHSYFGSLYVSGKLPTYPSPKPTFTLTLLT